MSTLSLSSPPYTHTPTYLISMSVVVRVPIIHVPTFLPLFHSLVSPPNLYELDSAPVNSSAVVCLPLLCEMQLYVFWTV